MFQRIWNIEKGILAGEPALDVGEPTGDGDPDSSPAVGEQADHSETPRDSLLIGGEQVGELDHHHLGLGLKPVEAVDHLRTETDQSSH